MENKKRFEEMSKFEIARWYSLIDGVDIIYSKCKDKNLNFDSLVLKPGALEKYIEATCDIFYKKIEKEESKNKKTKNMFFNNLIEEIQNV
jgi:hypothetical protein